MSLTSVTIISPEAANGRNVVALGVTKAFAAAKKTAVFRPAVCRKETFTDVLLEASNSGLSREHPSVFARSVHAPTRKVPGPISWPPTRKPSKPPSLKPWLLSERTNPPSTTRPSLRSMLT
mgnify:CR=1 FL=1